MSEAIGMMDRAYFVGKREIIDWINSLLLVSQPYNLYKKSECLYSCVFCV